MGVNAKKVEINSNFLNYIGVGLFKIVAINPNRQKLNEMYPNSTSTEEPVYFNKDKDGSDVFRIDIYCKLFENPDIPNYIHKVTFFLRNTPLLNRDKTSVKVINNYGQTIYIPIDHYKANTLPENLSWFPTPYKPCYPGQEEFIAFLKAYFATKELNKFVDGQPVRIEKPEDAEMFIEDVQAFLKGDLTEIADIVEYDNPIKIVVGVRTTDDNKVYQDTFLQRFIKANTKDYTYVQRHIDDAKNAGKYPNTVFSIENIHVYSNDVEKSVNTSTIPSYTDDNINELNTEDLPF